MRIHFAVAVELGPIQGGGMYYADVDAGEPVGDHITPLALTALTKMNFEFSSGALKLAESFHAFDFVRKRFLDKSKTWAQENIESDTIVVVINVKDADRASKVLRPATEMEKLAMEIRNGQ